MKPTRPAIRLFLLSATAGWFLVSGTSLAAQERSHTVVPGNTLWDLASAVYGDPYRWPSIWEANRDRVQDPHWIYPGQVLRIPMADGTVTEVVVGTTPAGAPAGAEPTGTPAAGEVGARGAPGMSGALNTAGASSRPERTAWVDPTERLPAVSDEMVAAAPFLLPEDGPVPSLGRVTGFAGAEEIRAPRSSARLYDRLTFEATRQFPAGTLVQVFRPGPVLAGVGRVAYPTGVVEVEPPAAGAPVVRVVAQFDALRPGDLLRPLPSAGLAPGVAPTSVANGARALLVGVARDHELQTVGDHVFLDAGRGQTRVGDEWVPVWPTAGPGAEEGRVQIVSVQDGVATARITNLVNPVFQAGLTLELRRRMPGG